MRPDGKRSTGDPLRVAGLTIAGVEEPGGKRAEGRGGIDEGGIHERVVEQAAEEDAAVETLMPGRLAGAWRVASAPRPESKARSTKGTRNSAPRKAIDIPCPPSGSTVPWQSPA